MDKQTILLIVSVALMGITRAFKEDLPTFRSLSTGVRALILALLAAGTGVIDMIATGSPFGVALQTMLKTAGPGLVLLLVELIGGMGGGSGAGGASGVPGGSSRLPPPPPVPGPMAAMAALRREYAHPSGHALIVGLCLALGAVAVACGPAKAITCPILRVADELCPLVMVELPDGGTEAIPKADIRRLAEAQRAARLAAERAWDAGAGK